MKAPNLPELISPRLRLRAPILDDFPSSLAMWSSPTVTRFIGGKPHRAEEVWARLLRYIGHWHALGYGYWSVETLEGQYVGEVGLADYRRDIDPPLGDSPEIGWALAPRAHGQGYASEAATAALAWRDTALPPGETVCIIAPEHAPSLRIAHKLGFRQTEEALYHGNVRLILRRATPA